MAEKITVIARNKKARHDYQIEEKYEAGIVLKGTEVKSCRLGKVNLKDGYARIKGGEIYLVDSHISSYPYANRLDHEPLRMRKLLFHKREVKKLIGKIREKGLSLVPLSIYFKNGKAKVEMGLARGKKLYDKRESLKRKTENREMRRAMKARR